MRMRFWSSYGVGVVSEYRVDGEFKVLLGDINGDGIIDDSDGEIIAQAYGYPLDIQSRQLHIPSHPCYGYLCNGTICASFNRFFYPVNHLFGSEFSATFLRKSEPYDSPGRSVEESLVIETLLREFPVNIPFFFVIGYIIGVALDKSTQKVRNMRKMQSRRNESERVL